MSSDSEYSDVENTVQDHIEVDSEEEVELSPYGKLSKELTDTLSSLQEEYTTFSEEFKEMYDSYKVMSKNYTKSIKNINSILKNLEKQKNAELKSAGKSRKKTSNGKKREPTGVAEPRPVPQSLVKYLDLETDALFPRTTVAKLVLEKFKTVEKFKQLSKEDVAEDGKFSGEKSGAYVISDKKVAKIFGVNKGFIVSTVGSKGSNNSIQTMLKEIYDNDEDYQEEYQKFKDNKTSKSSSA